MTNDTMQIDNETYITLADYARKHGTNGDRLRGMARDGKFPARQLFGKWIVVVGTHVPATAPRASARADGRKPYTVYATADEYAALIHAGHDVVDPRAVSRARRAAAKANANATD